MSRQRQPIDIQAKLSQLTLAEKVMLLSGAGACSTVGLPSQGIPVLNTSDGPHGLRGGGGRFFNPPPGYQLPSATAMGATFDADLLYRIGKLVGDEGRRKNVHMALAPTVCIQRSPLIGRGFEAYGEDPVLSGTLAAKFIDGIQSRNVGCCIKHFAAHDQSTNSKEDEIWATQRTLREIHLLPFQIAMAKSSAKPWGFMSSYNRINGIHASENPWLLDEVLRKEWEFEGLVLSDWWGTYSTSKSLNSGMDVEMPGPCMWRGKQLVTAVECRKVSMQTIDTSVGRLLQLINRTVLAPEPFEQGTGENTPESRALLRKLAGDSIVLLKNDQNLLPLNRDAKLSYGLIGQHWKIPATGGGGSSEATPFYVSTPYSAFLEAVGPEKIQYQAGCYARKWSPLIEEGLFLSESETPGLLLEWFGEDPSKLETAKCLRTDTTTSTSMYFSQMVFKDIPKLHYIRVRSRFKPSQSCRYRFGLCVHGKARLLIDGKEVIDQWSSQPAKTDDTPIFNKLSMERFYDLSVTEGQSYELEIIMTNDTDKVTIGDLGQGGVRLGGQVVLNEDQSISEAVNLARSVDVPIILAGLNADYESEAYDRKDLHLPGRTNELIQRVVGANPKTIIVTQAGMPFTMPWIEEVNTLVHAWFGGQETGHAIADILFGDVSPSGRLSVTFPKRIEDTPAFLNFGKSDHHIVYGEGVFVGHRYYEKLKIHPLFYFGFGLSYSHFQYTDLDVPAEFEPDPNHIMVISVEIKNVGSRDAAEAVQVYISDISCKSQRPRKELKSFKKVFVTKGSRRKIEIELDKYALSYWSQEFSRWTADAGTFEVIIAKSSDPRDELLKKTFELPRTFRWLGL